MKIKEKPMSKRLEERREFFLAIKSFDMVGFLDDVEQEIKKGKDRINELEQHFGVYGYGCRYCSAQGTSDKPLIHDKDCKAGAECDT